MLYYNQRMVDFVDGEVIDERILFYGFEDFFRRRLVIKTLLATKDRKDKMIYKWYLYASPFISDVFKNYMWDYLQGDISDLDFIMVYGQYCKKRKDT